MIKIDTEKLNEFNKLQKQSKIKQLLNESDYIELPSFVKRKGENIYQQWIAYRENLRMAYHHHTLPIPETPI